MISASINPALQRWIAELAEIDENLVRNDLHYTERGDYLRRRKEIFEGLYPETRREATLKQYRNAESAERTTKSFVDETSSKTGVSSRVIHEEIQIAESLPPEVKEIFEAIYPETRQGGDRKSENIKTKLFRIDSFADDAASKANVSIRTIEQEIQIAESLPPD